MIDQKNKQNFQFSYFDIFKGLIMNQLKLDDIQIGGIEFLLNHKFAILNLGTGVGKTDTLLSYLVKRDFDSCIIIVPKSVLVNWKRKVGSYFTDLLDGKLNVISFGMIAKFAPLITNASVVVIDEPKLLKNEDNQVHQLLLSLGSCGDQQRIILDATLIENNLGELDAIGQWFGGVADRRELLDYVYPPPGVKNEVARTKILKRIKVPVPSHKEAVVKFYEFNLARCFIPTPKSQKTINYAIMEMLNVLNSFSDGLGYYKLEALVALLKDKHSADAGVICVTRKEAMDCICKRLWTDGFSAAKFHGELSAKERQDVVNKFELGTVNWVVCTKAGERGLNLSRGSVVCHYDLPWAGSSFVQRDRVTRRDSDLTKETRIYVMMFADTVEELVYQKVKAKMRMNQALKDGIISNQWAPSWKSFLVDKYARQGKDLVRELNK